MGDNEKVMGQYRPTGIRPKCADRLRAYGIELSALLFGMDGQATGRRERW
jgi:hypothetical protein